MDDPAMTTPASARMRPSRADPSFNRVAKPESEPKIDNKQESQIDDRQECEGKNSRGWRYIVRNFTPSWFSVTSGTGVVALLLHAFPWQAEWLYYLSIIFFLLNVVLFFGALAISIVRYVLWPEIWSAMLNDSTNSLFLGTVPMGFGTLVEMWIFICVPAWGTWAAYVGWALWMVCATAAVLVTVGLSIMLMSAGHQRSLDTITAAQLLPISATVVAAGAGSRVAGVLPDPYLAMGTVITCYVLWGMALPIAYSVLVIYYHRLALHKMPPREVIVSAFLPLSPTGLGGYAILFLGRVAREVFPSTGVIDPQAGNILYIIGFIIALILWGWGMVWLLLALAAIYISRPIPFNMGWWGFTFPLGVYAICTIFIGKELPSLFFRVLGTIFGVAVILLWIVITIGTVRGAWSGELFHAPCLENLKPSVSQHRAQQSDEEAGCSAASQDEAGATMAEQGRRSDSSSCDC